MATNAHNEGQNEGLDGLDDGRRRGDGDAVRGDEGDVVRGDEGLDEDREGVSALECWPKSQMARCPGYKKTENGFPECVEPKRDCLHCGAPLHATRRRSAQFCNAACRAASWRDANAPAPMSPDEYIASLPTVGDVFDQLASNKEPTS